MADDHQAALSVGISLHQIWAIVWFASGVVALVTGIMWAARSDVSFALEIIALKALAVLILGGFTSIPGAIVGGLMVGIGEKTLRGVLGADLRRRRRGLVRLCAGAHFPAVQAPGPVRRTDHRENLMLYREAGQFKTKLCSRSGAVSDSPGPYRYSAHPVCGLRAGAVARHAVLPEFDHDPVSGVFAGGDRSEYPDRLRRATVAGIRRLHGGGGL